MSIATEPTVIAGISQGLSATTEGEGADAPSGRSTAVDLAEAGPGENVPNGPMTVDEVPLRTSRNETPRVPHPHVDPHPPRVAWVGQPEQPWRWRDGGAGQSGQIRVAAHDRIQDDDVRGRKDCRELDDVAVPIVDAA